MLEVLQFEAWPPALGHVPKQVLLLAVPKLEVECLAQAPTPPRLAHHGQGLVGLPAYSAVLWGGRETWVIATSLQLLHVLTE